MLYLIHGLMWLVRGVYGFVAILSSSQAWNEPSLKHWLVAGAMALVFGFVWVYTGKAVKKGL